MTLGGVICKNKDTFKLPIKKLKASLSRNYFYGKREWVYKDIEPLILIDELLDDGVHKELRDYKFWCFNGTPQYMYITIKGKGVFENFYDMNFNLVDINHGFKRHVPEFERPEAFEEMKALCTKLLDGLNIPFVRVDFFYVNKQIYFGEFTFYDWAGLRPFKEKSWDERLGEMIQLPIS